MTTDTSAVGPAAEDPEEINDGYHTMDELYQHRAALWMALALTPGLGAWKSRKHEVGSTQEMFEGYFIVGAQLPGAGPVTYHLEEKYWAFCPGAELPNALSWDGHTADDVVKRLIGYVSEATAARLRETEARVQAEQLKLLAWPQLSSADHLALVRYLLMSEKNEEAGRAAYPALQTRGDIRNLPRALALEVADSILAEAAGTTGRPTSIELANAIGERSWCSLLAEGVSGVGWSGVVSADVTWADFDEQDQAALVQYVETYTQTGDAVMMFKRPDFANLSPNDADLLAREVVSLLVGKQFKDVSRDDVLDALGSVKWGQLKNVLAGKKNDKGNAK